MSLELCAIGSLCHRCVEAPARPWPIVDSELSNLSTLIGSLSQIISYHRIICEKRLAKFNRSFTPSTKACSPFPPLKSHLSPPLNLHTLFPSSLDPWSAALSCIRQSNSSRAGEEVDCAISPTFESSHLATSASPAARAHDISYPTIGPDLV